MYGREEFGTFSIVAADVDSGYWGVAVSTKPMAVGAIVPWAEWRVGAIATQAMANYLYGPKGLDLLRRRVSAPQVVARLTRADPGREHRQLAIVDRRGRAAAWTGSKCMESAIHVVGDGYSCQGNIVASEEVVRSMARTYERSRGTMAQRFLKTLQAGQRAGGDRRGLSSAAILVVHRERWFDPVWPSNWVNLRVDAHPAPIRELGRILRIDESATRRFLRQRAAAERRRTRARSR
jgi:uncharacterized Ntn-hydrolase superfamily protein